MKRAVALFVVAAVAMAACTGGGDGNSREPASSDVGTEEPTESTPSTADFYAVPDPLPSGEPGTLIRHEAISGYSVGNATAYRIMYLSRSARDEPVAVTGTALIPPGDAPADGRRLVTIAHGTTGLGDSCAPSKNPRLTELTFMGPAMEQGVIAVMSDYEGLGTPGVHPYLVAASEGHSVLDAARAAAQLPGADAGTRIAIGGYSQGGHGALAASSIAASYAPELELVGTFAGAPPSELPTILSAGPSRPESVGLVMMMIAGTHAAYPEADPELVLTPEGLNRLGAVEDSCTGDLADIVASTPSAQLFKADLAAVEPWVAVLHQSNQGQIKIESPILIVHSAVDEVVPELLSKIVFDRMCGLGQVVERRVYDAGDHGQAAIRALPEAARWLTDRFEGIPAISTCGQPE